MLQLIVRVLYAVQVIVLEIFPSLPGERRVPCHLVPIAEVFGMGSHSAFGLDVFIHRGWKGSIWIFFCIDCGSGSRAGLKNTTDTAIPVIHDVVRVDEIYGKEKRLPVLILLFPDGLNPVNGFPCNGSIFFVSFLKGAMPVFAITAGLPVGKAVLFQRSIILRQMPFSFVGSVVSRFAQ